MTVLLNNFFIDRHKNVKNDTNNFDTKDTKFILSIGNAMTSFDF